MKTKLLRKVRKRYSITYYPYGSPDTREAGIGWPVFILEDNERAIFKTLSCSWVKDKEDPDCFPTKELAYDNIYKKLLFAIKRDYGHLGIRRNKILNKKEKLWYNG